MHTKTDQSACTTHAVRDCASRRRLSDAIFSKLEVNRLTSVDRTCKTSLLSNLQHVFQTPHLACRKQPCNAGFWIYSSLPSGFLHSTHAICPVPSQLAIVVAVRASIYHSVHILFFPLYVYYLRCAKQPCHAHCREAVQGQAAAAVRTSQLHVKRKEKEELEIMVQQVILSRFAALE